MSSGTLYTYPDNFRAFKALIAAQYSGFKLKVAENFVFGETNREPGFLKKFPLGKVPALDADGGVHLVESNAIAYYVANEQLRGGNDKKLQAEVLQWMAFADSEILPAACTWVFPVMGIMQYNKQNTDRAKETIKESMTYLNSHLLTRTFLVGERITLADIVVACTMLSLYEHVLDPGFRGAHGNVNRWFTTVINQKQAKAVIGEFKLCAKMGEFDAKKYAEIQGKLGGGEGDAPAGGKKDKKKEKKEEKKKEEKPAKKKEEEPAEEMDEAELALAAEPKAKDPFAAMPKGTFDMDDFKRFYSNEDEAKSVPYFWEKFDKENYSIWFGTITVFSTSLLSFACLLLLPSSSSPSLQLSPDLLNQSTQPPASSIAPVSTSNCDHVPLLTSTSSQFPSPHTMLCAISLLPPDLLTDLLLFHPSPSSS